MFVSEYDEDLAGTAGVGSGGLMKLKLGVVVNPLAGLGGAVALKGSDGAEVVAEARRRGAMPMAVERAARALGALAGLPVEVHAWGGAMGEDSVRMAGLTCIVAGHAESAATTNAEDTRRATYALLQGGIDLLVFAGGDGTARDVLAVHTGTCPVLGIPAGCKMHSGVYANNPEDAGRLLRTLVDGGLVELVEAEVRDIDEVAFREGKVYSRYHGTLKVPRSNGLLQQVKTGGRRDDGVILAEMAAFMIEQMKEDADYLMGSGSTVAEVMRELGLPNTLLGVDLVRDGECIGQDLSAADILRLTGDRPLHAVLTVIGGQGHLFGRGNQQFSPEVIRRISRDHLHILATRGKLTSLGGRPLQLDTGDAQLDQTLSGWVPVVTGYDETVLYRLGVSDGEKGKNR
jgi:predicted polyphosphate/ATP-dependent NAD kinase